MVDGARVVVGSHRLFEERGAVLRRRCTRASRRRARGRRPDDGDRRRRTRRSGSSACRISPRESARDAVQLLRAQGIAHVALLTGDHEPAARALAAAVGIDEVRAGLLPADKVGAVEELRAPLRHARDGRRRRQRRARAGRRRRRHRDGRRRHRRRARDRRRRADGRRAAEDPLRASPEPRHDAQHPREHRVLDRAQGARSW